MEDLIQLAAYVLIFLIIGIASIVKKYVDAQKRRKELEAKQLKSLRVEEGQAQPQTSTVTIEQIPEIEEEEPEPAPAYPEDRPVSIEDVLRKILAAPAEVPKPQPIKEVVAEQEPPKIIEEEKVSRIIPDTSFKPAPQELMQQPGGWQDFIDRLKQRDLTEMQRAIIIADIIKNPGTAKWRYTKVNDFGRFNR